MRAPISSGESGFSANCRQRESTVTGRKLLLPLQERGDDGGAHAPGALLAGLGEHGAVGLVEGVKQGLGGVLAVSGAHSGDDGVHGDLAGDLARLVAAHAVTDDEQPLVLAELLDAEVVFVLLAHASGVGEPVDERGRWGQRSPREGLTGAMMVCLCTGALGGGGAAAGLGATGAGVVG